MRAARSDVRHRAISKFARGAQPWSRLPFWIGITFWEPTIIGPYSKRFASYYGWLVRHRFSWAARSVCPDRISLPGQFAISV